MWNYLKVSHFQAIHIVIIWSKIQIPNQGCKWINYLLPITIQQLLLEIFRFWSFLIVTCITTPWPQHVILYATLLWLRLESILGTYLTSSIVSTLFLLYSIDSGTFSHLIVFHKADSTTKVWNYAIFHTFSWEKLSFETIVWIFNKKLMLIATIHVFLYYEISQT